LSGHLQEDDVSGEEERIPSQKRRGRPQKPLVDEIDEDGEKMEDEENVNVNDVALNTDVKVIENGKKRKRNKSKEEGNLVKEDTDDSVIVNGFRHTGSRRKNKPRRAAEVGVECK